MNELEPTRVETNIACPGCACVCDDLTLTFRGEQLTDVAPRCSLAQLWFERNARAVTHATEVVGQPVDYSTAVARAAEILRSARYPLIYGLSRSSTPGQKQAIELADRLGAVIDTTASLCHGPSILALQVVGESTATLGEMRNRSDLVIFWGCDPATTHPRHAERYSVFPRGQFVPRGRENRTIVMIGDGREVHHWRLDEQGSRPDVVIPIQTGRDFEAITALRAILKGESLTATDANSLGASFADLLSLVDRMRRCRSGVVFFGLGLTGMSLDRPNTAAPLGHANVENLLRLVTELNSVTRFYARRMRLQGDVSGADSVLCWRTGFPFSVDLARGFPRYNPAEYSANTLLERREPDACLLVGSETVPAFSPAARRYLESVPTVVLEYPGTDTCFAPSVRFFTAPYGLSAPGTIYRMDEVPLALRATTSSRLPTDETVLRDLRLAAVG